MKLAKENVRIIFEKLLDTVVDTVELWDMEDRNAEKQLAYIAGLKDMADAVIEAIGQLGGK